MAESAGHTDKRGSYQPARPRAVSGPRLSAASKIRSVLWVTTAHFGARVTGRKNLRLQGLCASSVLLLPLEMAQVGGRLAPVHRHQQLIGAEHVMLMADFDMHVAFRTNRFDPDRVLAPPHGLGDLPRTRQRVVLHRDLIVES